jgi:hypothetical protein
MDKLNFQGTSDGEGGKRRMAREGDEADEDAGVGHKRQATAAPGDVPGRSGPAAAASPAAGPADPLSDYELMRLQNIRRNDARLASLGLGGADSTQAQLKQAARPPARKRAPPVVYDGPVRSSGRTRRPSVRLPHVRDPVQVPLPPPNRRLGMPKCSGAYINGGVRGGSQHPRGRADPTGKQKELTASASGFKGVSGVREKWQAYIYMPGGKKQVQAPTSSLVARASVRVRMRCPG